MNRYIFRYTSGGFQYEHNRKPLKIAVLWQQTRNPSDSALRVFGEIRKPFFSCQNGGIPTISRHTAQNRECTEMYANANISGTQQGTRVGYPTRQPTTALQIGHRVGNGHERGFSLPHNHPRSRSPQRPTIETPHPTESTQTRPYTAKRPA